MSFSTECIVKNPNTKIKHSDLYHAYLIYTKRNGTSLPLCSKDFSIKFAQLNLGIRSRTSDGAYAWEGIEISKDFISSIELSEYAALNPQKGLRKLIKYPELSSENPVRRIRSMNGQFMLAIPPNIIKQLNLEVGMQLEVIASESDDPDIEYSAISFVKRGTHD